MILPVYSFDSQTGNGHTKPLLTGTPTAVDGYTIDNGTVDLLMATRFNGYTLDSYIFDGCSFPPFDEYTAHGYTVDGYKFHW